MAESSVTFFLEKLNNLVVREACVFGEVEGEVKLLRNELRWMRLFLKEADSQSIHDERIKLWVEQIREVAHDAEDVIDLFIFNVDPERQQRRLKLLPSCLVFVDKLPLIHELEGKITVINVMIEKIMANRSKYGFDTLLTASSSSADHHHRRRRQTPTFEETQVVEIKEGLEAVKNMLLIDGEADEKKQRAVVFIVGMGGLGKTTLAEKVYHHRDVKHHFNCHAWVYVSQEFTLRDLLLNIIDSAMSLTEKEKREMKEMKDKEVGKKLHDFLADKRYLVVMDDIWSIEAWRCLASHLPDSENGSRVLITTRNKEIAEKVHANPHELDTHTYQLRLMDDDESWELFLRKTFGAMDITKLPPLEKALEDLGRKIVGKCKGLPLAVVVLGGLLSTKETTPESWAKVLQSVDWHLINQGGSQSCLGILALSYHDLPYYLKSCFLYCGIFPEDYKIKARKLISVWIAEGFIERRGKETLEDIGEDYLKELIHRSMLQVAAKKPNGRVKACRMHDLLRDLAIAEARDARLFEVQENFDLITTGRRLSITQPHLIPKNNSPQHLHRSLFFFTDPTEKKVWTSIKEHVKLLGVLDLVGIERICTLPKDISKGIGELVHLKFLCINGSRGTVKLPSSIDRLTSLQFLEIRLPIRLPHQIWNLQRLRHLNCPLGRIASQSRLSKCKIKGGVQQLAELQTLIVPAGSWLYGNGLGKLTQLRKLRLKFLTSTHLRRGLFDSITELTALRTLNLHLGFTDYDDPDVLLSFAGLKFQQLVAEEKKPLVPGLMSLSRHIYLYKLVLSGKLEKLPEQIEFYPPNLLQLDLSTCWLKDDPMLVLRKLPNLRFLRLLADSFVGKSMTCSREGFQKLETLEIGGLNQVEELIVEEGAMCNLRTLKVWFCKEMQILPRGLGLLRLKKLEKFVLVGVACHDLIEEVQQSEGDEWDRIRSITSIKYLFN